MIFRLRDFAFYPLAIWRFDRQLLESQYWSPAKRRAWVQERLERTLSHAVKNVPYYKRSLGPLASHFNEMIDRLDLSELPYLTKDAIRNHYDELCAVNANHSRTVPVNTGGSTGTPTRFFLDREANVSHFASIWRVLNWAGYRFGNRFADLTGHVFKNDRLFEYDPRLNCLYLSSFNFKKENIPLYVERLKKFRPVLIKAYPSALDLFCRWVNETGLSPYRPRAVLTCAESLLDHQRAVIEQTLQSPVFDFYNQNERAALISTCERQVNHIHEEYSHVELARTSDNGLLSSQSAEIVATMKKMTIEIALVAVTVKVPDEVYREASEERLGNVALLILKVVGSIGLLALIVTGFIISSRHSGLSWRKAARLTALTAAMPCALTSDRPTSTRSTPGPRRGAANHPSGR